MDRQTVRKYTVYLNGAASAILILPVNAADLRISAQLPSSYGILDESLATT